MNAAALREAIPALSSLFDTDLPPLPCQGGDDLFAGLCEAIVSQQLSGKAAATIWGRVTTALGALTPARLTTMEVPETLRAAGVSGAKGRALVDLAARVVDGRLDLEVLPGLSDEEVRDRLMTVKGIGRWTADMALIFLLDRPDVLPTADLGIRKAAARACGLEALPDPETLTRLAEPWRPHRTLVCRYLWRSLDAAAPVS